MARQDSTSDGASMWLERGHRSRSVSGRAVALLAMACVVVAGCGRTSLTVSGSSGGSGGSTSSSGPPGAGGSGVSTPVTTPVITSSTSAAPGAYSVPEPTCDAAFCQPDCNSSVSGGGTTIRGAVYDPAGINPIPRVDVFVADPRVPLPDLSLLGTSSFCGCNGLYPTDVLASGSTGLDGHFTIPKAPSGDGFTIVIQTGQWRRAYGPVTLSSCVDNEVGKLTLPKNGSEGDLPEIAISTGGGDSLECLLTRIGVSSSEYTSGAGGTGHIHIFQGYRGATTNPPAPFSYQQLWGSLAQLQAYGIVLLSCEGHETTGGIPGVSMNSGFQQNLRDYANAGGHVLASHYHYKWFNAGPFSISPGPLATWQGSDGNPEAVIADDSLPVPVVIDTTFPVSAGGAAFPQGQLLHDWLNLVGALTNDKLPIWFARDNVVAADQPPSVEWMRLDSTLPSAALVGAAGATQYFDVRMPIDAPANHLCGRIAFSELHVGGGPNVTEPPNCNGSAPSATCVPADYAFTGLKPPTLVGAPSGTPGVVPDGCVQRALTPQEAALEYMLFDLSACQALIPPAPYQVARP